MRERERHEADEDPIGIEVGRQEVALMQCNGVEKVWYQKDNLSITEIQRDRDEHVCVCVPMCVCMCFRRGG